MNKYLLLLLCWLLPILLFSQEESTPKNVGVYFYGYLGLMPGIQVDYQLKSWNIGTKQKTSFHLRPAIAYNHLLKYSNNFQVLMQGTLEQHFFKPEKDKALNVELKLSLGFQRAIYYGEIYEVNGDSFDESQAAGINGLMLGGGLGLNGNLIKGKLLWHAGIIYLNEISKGPGGCLLYTSPSPRDRTRSRMPSSA